MILRTDQLADHRHAVAMVDGGFDPLHAGHIAYFREATTKLAAPLLCNVSGDAYVARKHPVFLPQDERAAVIDAIRFVSYTHISTVPTVEILRELVPRYYVKGKDWVGRLPVEELDVCATGGVEIVYLDTVLNSSTALLSDYVRRANAVTASLR